MRTIGEWYRDNVLNHPEWVEVDLPNGQGEIRIERQLFSWFLYHGKKYIECQTEEEARYLKAFLQAERPFIKMPKDREYLRQILPDLERLMRRTLEFVEDYTAGILNDSKREKVISLFWYKAMREGYEAEEKLEAKRNLRRNDEEEDDEEDEEKDAEMESQK